MKTSEIGDIVLAEWEISFEIRTEFFCDAFVIMPNQIHAILCIDKSKTWDDGYRHDARRVNGDERPCLSTIPPPTTPTYDDITPHSVGYRFPKSISSFVAGFKSAATKRINQLRNTPGKTVWQPRFHDHVIPQYQGDCERRPLLC